MINGFVMRHNSSLVCTVGIAYVYIDTIFCVLGTFFFFLFFFFNTHLYCFFLARYFEHDFLDTGCLGHLICMCFTFSYLHVFSAIEHVSRGKALEKYTHYYYYLKVQPLVLVVGGGNRQCWLTGLWWSCDWLSRPAVDKFLLRTTKGDTDGLITTENDTAR